MANSLLTMPISERRNLRCICSAQPLTHLDKDALEVVTPQGPGFDQMIVHLNSGRECFVRLLRFADQCKEHTLQSIELSSHLVGEVLQIGRLDHFQTLNSTPLQLNTNFLGV